MTMSDEVEAAEAMVGMDRDTAGLTTKSMVEVEKEDITTMIRRRHSKSVADQ
jgi:hypothetical protein